MWYVVQVTGGTEERMAELIESVATPGVLEECFLPRYQTEIKVRGEFRPVEKPLLTGYLFAVTADPARLARDLAKIPEFARVLKVGEAYAPLSREEEAWLGAFTAPGHRSVPMSYGVMAGEKIVVTEGPLKGHEAMIAEVDRRRSVAYLRFEICGREVTTRVGLGLVARLPETARAEAESVVSERRARARGGEGPWKEPASKWIGTCSPWRRSMDARLRLPGTCRRGLTSRPTTRPSGCGGAAGATG